MIDLTINQQQMKKNAKYCKEKNIILPTFAQMKNPEIIPEQIKNELKKIGLWDVHPRNLFRITWKNENVAQGGGYRGPNYMILPRTLTGLKTNIIALVGKWFPTGAHKVGATYGCLIPRLITGQFDPTKTKAVWPSTGNYCRGGAYVSALLACQSIAILPEEMSQERFEWLSKVAGEVIATPGCESNVKEIFDKCWELRARGDDLHIFNQFEEFGNTLWHYEVTGNALFEALQKEMKITDSFAGFISSSGSAGTLGCGYFLKQKFPYAKLAVAEAAQCPTLLNNGFGGHRIEGIGDKHVPWIHDAKDTDMIIDVDDEDTIRVLRLFNEKKGIALLKQSGVDSQLADNLHLLGISSIGNLIAAIKFAKYYELTENDYVATVFTDSMELYKSRVRELEEERGSYNETNAHLDRELLSRISTDFMQELTYYDKKRIHNLKYYTWIEQQQRSVEELNNQWYNHDNYWGKILKMAPIIDQQIVAFNDLITSTND